MKHYYVSCELSNYEAIPNYNFVLKAENIDIAEKEARIIILQDYPDYYEYIKLDIEEIDAPKLLQILTIN